MALWLEERRKRKRGASEGGTGENDAENLKYKEAKETQEENSTEIRAGASKDVVIGWRKWTGEESEEAKLEGKRMRDERVEQENKGKIKVEWKIGNEGAVEAEMEIR